MWTALNIPNYTFDESDSSFEGTYVMLAASQDNLNTELSPFCDASGQKYWTPNTVVSTETFNYAYPETQRWKYKTDAEYQQSIKTTVQKFYGATSDKIVNNPAPLPPTGSESQQPLTETACTYTDYIATIKATKHGLGEAYRVHIFLGDFPADESLWHTLEQLAGIFMGKSSSILDI